MTKIKALALLKEYGLETDLKSIRERTRTNEYWQYAYKECEEQGCLDELENIAYVLYEADQTIIFALAEKSGRIERFINDFREDNLRNRQDCLMQKSDDITPYNIIDNVLEKIESILKEE